MGREFVEALESRQFLSAELISVKAGHEVPVMVETSVALKNSATRASRPNCKGVWTGSLGTMYIKKQTTKGAISGTLVMGGRRLAVTGTISTTRSLKFKFSGGGILGNATAKVSANSRTMAGNYVAYVALSGMRSGAFYMAR